VVRFELSSDWVHGALDACVYMGAGGVDGHATPCSGNPTWTCCQVAGVSHVRVCVYVVDWGVRCVCVCVW
jgi:hypothetical protein